MKIGKLEGQIQKNKKAVKVKKEKIIKQKTQFSDAKKEKSLAEVTKDVLSGKKKKLTKEDLMKFGM